MSFTETAKEYAVPVLTGIFWLTLAVTSYVVRTYWRERRAAARQSLSNPRSSLGKYNGTETSPGLELSPAQVELLRAAVVPELREFVKQSIVQGLAAQRDALVTLQQQAHQSIVELESRLSSLQAPLQERIKAYEERISELERELVAQNCDMRNLTREMLLLTRQKLAQEVEQAGVATPTNFPPESK